MPVSQISQFIRTGDTFTPHKHERYLLSMMQTSNTAKGRENMYGSAAAFCPRLNFAYNKLTNIEVDTSPESVLYMSIGSGIELALSNSLFAKDRLFFSNLRLPRADPYVSGKIDLVYLDEQDEIIIGEVKSCGRLPAQPKYSHMQQLLTYLAFGGYKKGKLIYISRNVSDGRRTLIRVFDADNSKPSMLKILSKVCYTQFAIDANLMPGIPADFKKSLHCGYCQFAEACWRTDPLSSPEDDPFRAFTKVDKASHAALLDRAKERARELYATSDVRYVTSLRHIYDNIKSEDLKSRLMDEVVRYE